MAKLTVLSDVTDIASANKAIKQGDELITKGKKMRDDGSILIDRGAQCWLQVASWIYSEAKSYDLSVNKMLEQLSTGGLEISKATAYRYLNQIPEYQLEQQYKKENPTPDALRKRETKQTETENSHAEKIPDIQYAEFTEVEPDKDLGNEDRSEGTKEGVADAPSSKPVETDRKPKQKTGEWQESMMAPIGLSDVLNRLSRVAAHNLIETCKRPEYHAVLIEGLNDYLESHLKLQTDIAYGLAINGLDPDTHEPLTDDSVDQSNIQPIDLIDVDRYKLQAQHDERLKKDKEAQAKNESTPATPTPNLPNPKSDAVSVMTQVDFDERKQLAEFLADKKVELGEKFNTFDWEGCTVKKSVAEQHLAFHKNGFTKWRGKPIRIKD